MQERPDESALKDGATLRESSKTRKPVKAVHVSPVKQRSASPAKAAPISNASTSSTRGAGLRSLLQAAAPKSFLPHSGLALLKSTAMLVKLLPPDPFPFSPCPSKFNKDTIRRERERVRREAPIELVRRKKRYATDGGLGTSRLCGAAHLESLMNEVERRYLDHSKPLLQTSAMQSVLQRLEAIEASVDGRKVERRLKGRPVVHSYLTNSRDVSESISW